MELITIQINGVRYVVKQSFRSLMLFEEMTGKSINEASDSVGDLVKMFYCILKGCNMKEFTYSFDEFLDLIDKEPETIEVFSNYLNDQAKEKLFDDKKKQENQ